MAEQPTCGQGLAEHAAIPAGIAEVAEAMADNLQLHMNALDLDDDAARQEHSVYLRLAEEYRQAATRLRVVGQEMAAQRDLPMGRHDQQALGSQEVAEAFRRFVTAKEELVAVLQRLLQQDQQLLAQMGAADQPPQG